LNAKNSTQPNEEKSMGFVSRFPENEGSIATILKPYPDIADPVSMMTEYVMRSEDSQFTLAERELIATYVCDLNSCTYCARTHQAAAEALGVDKNLFKDLLKNIDTAPVKENIKSILKFVKKLTLSPSLMTQADADAIFDAGWDENAFHFAIMICGMFNLYNRLLEGYGIKSSEESHEQAGQALAESGYMHVKEAAEQQR
jgi:uncharacterized peroxidase-related enzyme